MIKEKEQRGQQTETGMAIGICRVRKQDAKIVLIFLGKSVLQATTKLENCSTVPGNEGRTTLTD